MGTADQTTNRNVNCSTEHDTLEIHIPSGKVIGYFFSCRHHVGSNHRNYVTGCQWILRHKTDSPSQTLKL